MLSLSCSRKLKRAKGKQKDNKMGNNLAATAGYANGMPQSLLLNATTYQRQSLDTSVPHSSSGSSHPSAHTTARSGAASVLSFCGEPSSFDCVVPPRSASHSSGGRVAGGSGSATNTSSGIDTQGAENNNANDINAQSGSTSHPLNPPSIMHDEVGRRSAQPVPTMANGRVADARTLPPIDLDVAYTPNSRSLEEGLVLAPPSTRTPISRAMHSFRSFSIPMLPMVGDSSATPQELDSMVSPASFLTRWSEVDTLRLIDGANLTPSAAQLHRAHSFVSTPHSTTSSSKLSARRSLKSSSLSSGLPSTRNGRNVPVVFITDDDVQPTSPDHDEALLETVIGDGKVCGSTAFVFQLQLRSSTSSSLHEFPAQQFFSNQPMPPLGGRQHEDFVASLSPSNNLYHGGRFQLEQQPAAASS